MVCFGYSGVCLCVVYSGLRQDPKETSKYNGREEKKRHANTTDCKHNGEKGETRKYNGLHHTHTHTYSPTPKLKPKLKLLSLHPNPSDYPIPHTLSLTHYPSHTIPHIPILDHDGTKAKETTATRARLTSNEDKTRQDKTRQDKTRQHNTR